VKLIVNSQLNYKEITFCRWYNWFSFPHKFSRTTWDAENVWLQDAERHILTEGRGSSEQAGETYIMSSFIFILINTKYWNIYWGGLHSW